MKKTRIFAAIAIAVVLLTAFFLAPVVGYSQDITIPGAYEPGADACFVPLTQTTTTLTQTTTTTVIGNSTQGSVNATLQYQKLEKCLNQYLYPPQVINEQGTLAYRLFGIGTSPFPDHVSFSKGNYSVLVFFNRTKASSAYEFFSPRVIFEPTNIVEVVNASVVRTGWGGLEFLASVKNVGNSAVTYVDIAPDVLSVPGLRSFATTSGGLKWYPIVPGDDCSLLLKPGQTCSASINLGNETLPTEQLRFNANVVGVLNGSVFFYSQVFVEPSPQPGLNQDWVKLFVGRANQERTGPPLAENSTLDRLAALRFRTASSQPQISDYGFSSDLSSFFGGEARSSTVTELLLFPGSSVPYLYATELQDSGPGHWASLIRSNFTQYGYYIGKAPYYQISANCPATEIPSAGVNITQYFESYGCTVTPVGAMNWLVMILAQ